MLVIFDCDGTLVDSQANIICAMEDSFERHRLTPPDRQAIRRVVGLSLLPAMQALVPEGDVALLDSLAEDYKQAFHRLRAAGQLAAEPLFPGVRDALETLRGAGVILGVATGKSDRGLALCLEHHGLTSLFTTLQTADRHPSKPHPSMIQQCLLEADRREDQAWMIGDTTFDIAMAGNAGVRGIGVDWGYHDPHELTAAGAAHVVGDAAAMTAIILETEQGR
jgi:phosphoglycolate phosphatase